jgi:hypothetical protein
MGEPQIGVSWVGIWVQIWRPGPGEVWLRMDLLVMGVIGVCVGILAQVDHSEDHEKWTGGEGEGILAWQTARPWRSPTQPDDKSISSSFRALYITVGATQWGCQIHHLFDRYSYCMTVLVTQKFFWSPKRVQRRSMGSSGHILCFIFTKKNNYHEKRNDMKSFRKKR